MPRVTLLAGGVGGARFARGLLTLVRPADVTIVGNVGDDLEHWGLSISPDLDTLLYTLTGRIHPGQGWGVAGDTREAMAVVSELGGLDWFILGDRDIGLHLVRSERLRAGEPLSAVTADLARRYGLGARLLPATDDRLRTRIVTPDGELAFQEWLVGRRAADPVRAVRFEGAPGARPAPGVLEAIQHADVIVLAPSNPFVSLDPILAVDGLRAAVEARRDRVIAVTPMIGTQAVKGPLAGMLETLGHEVSAVGVASVLAPLATGFVLDAADREREPDVRALGLSVACVPTLMGDTESSAAVARAALSLA
jgi:LPPG:FO 2-phospho-L-lactate transferase